MNDTMVEAEPLVLKAPGKSVRMKKQAAEWRHYNFDQAVIFDTDILDVISEQGYRPAGNVEGDGADAGFSTITNGFVTYGIKFGKLGTEYENKILITERKARPRPMRSGYGTSINGAAVLEKTHPSAGRNGKDLEIAWGYSIVTGADDKPAEDASRKPADAPGETKDVKLEPFREYSMHDLDLMDLRNRGPAGTYRFMRPGSDRIYPMKETRIGYFKLDI